MRAVGTFERANGARVCFAGSNEAVVGLYEDENGEWRYAAALDEIIVAGTEMASQVRAVERWRGPLRETREQARRDLVCAVEALASALRWLGGDNARV